MHKPTRIRNEERQRWFAYVWVLDDGRCAIVTSSLGKLVVTATRDALLKMMGKSLYS